MIQKSVRRKKQFMYVISKLCHLVFINEQKQLEGFHLEWRIENLIHLIFLNNLFLGKEFSGKNSVERYCHIKLFCNFQDSRTELTAADAVLRIKISSRSQLTYLFYFFVNYSFRFRLRYETIDLDLAQLSL